MKVLKIYFIFYFPIIIKCYPKSNTVNPPSDLKHIYIIYTSWFSISKIKPIINQQYIFFIENKNLKAFDYNNLRLGFFASIIYPFGNNYYIKPIETYENTEFSLYSNFFTKNCHLYQYYDDNFKKPINDLKFDEFDKNDCYDSLRIYYNNFSGYGAVYNIFDNKIIVFNMKNVLKLNSNSKYKETFKASMNNKIIKAFIFSNAEKTEILLIGIDIKGYVNFWGLEGYCGYWKKFNCESGNLIKSFKFDILNVINNEIATIIDKNKLLYINLDYFIIIDLIEVKLINNQKHSIKDFSCLLGLRDGNALIGTNNGFIYLIKYQNSKIIILDKRELCPKQKIYSLSSISNCTSGSFMCYIIAANCNYIKIFEIMDTSSDYDL